MSLSHVESDIFSIGLDRIWDKLSKLQFEKLFPKIIKSTKYISGSPMIIGSKINIVHTNGQEYVVEIEEVSMPSHTIQYQFVSANPAFKAESINAVIQLDQISELNQTMMTWKYSFSADIQPQELSVFKERILNCFQNLESFINSERKAELVKQQHDFPSEYKQAKNILVMLGSNDITSWEKAKYVIENQKKPRSTCPKHHFVYEKFLDIAHNLYCTIYAQNIQDEGFGKCQRKISVQNDQNENDETYFHKTVKERNQAQNILHMLSSRNLESWETVLEVVQSSKKPRNDCCKEFNYEAFLKYLEEFYYKQHDLKLRKKSSVTVEEPKITKNIKYNPTERERKQAKNILIMLSNKDLKTWDEAKVAIENNKKPRNECDSEFDYDKFLDFVKKEYDSLYGMGNLSRKSSQAISEENELEELYIKKYQSGITDLGNQTHEYVKERDQAKNILAMLPKSQLHTWQDAKKVLMEKKPHDFEHCGADFEYDQFLIQAEILYHQYYQLPNTSPQKKRSEQIQQ